MALICAVGGGPLTLAEYERARIVFVDDLPRLGAEGPRLAPETFYDYVGRPDLRDAYRRRLDWGVRLGGAGGQTLLAGVVLLALGAPRFVCRDDHWSCARGFDAAFWGGVAAAAVGAVTTAVAMTLDPEPTTLVERVRLADALNATLRRTVVDADAAPR